MLFNQKSAQMALKWTVSIISENGLKVIFFSLIFCMKLRVHKGLKVTDGIKITQRGVKQMIWDNPPSSCSDYFLAESCNNSRGSIGSLVLVYHGCFGRL